MTSSPGIRFGKSVLDKPNKSDCEMRQKKKYKKILFIPKLTKLASLSTLRRLRV
jgi:hypothetical protein